MSTSVSLSNAIAPSAAPASSESSPGAVADAAEALPETNGETGAGEQQALTGGEEDFAAQTYSLRANLLHSELNTAFAAEQAANTGKASRGQPTASEPANAAQSQRQAAATQKGAKPAGKAGKAAPAQPAMQQLPNVTVKANQIKALERGPLTDVNAIVLHRTAGSKLDLVTPSTTRLGTHYYIDKNGDIYQTASLDKYTAHVGKIRSKCIEEGGCTDAALQAAKKDAKKGLDALSQAEHKKPYGDRYPTNRDSIGIEVVGKYDERTKTWDAPTEAQQKALDQLVDALKSKYNLTDSDIYQHDKISYKTAGEGAGLGY